VEIGSGTLYFSEPYLQTAGSTTLRGGNMTAPGAVDIQSGSLGGSGTITANVTCSGSVNPGDPVGVLRIIGEYVQTTSAALTFELAGTEPDTRFDQLLISGKATLDGRLNARLVSGFVPGFNNRFEVLACGSRLGTFASFLSDPLPPGNFLNPVYLPGGVDLVTLDARPTFMAGSLSMTDGQFRFQLTGIAAQPYAIEAATNLEPPVSWTILATNVLPGSTLWEFVDPDATNYPHRFYRARYAP
jgi:hypothetical protein